MRPGEGQHSSGHSATALSSGEFYVPLTGVLAKLRVYVSSNTTAAGSTVTLLVDGVATGLTVSYGSGATGLQSELGATANVTAGQRVAIKVVAASGGGKITIESVSFDY